MLLLLAALMFPAFDGYVVDSAGVIPAEEAQQIAAICERLDHARLAQIAVATVRDLGGLDRPQYAVQLFEQWKLGHSKQRSDGLLLLFSPARSGKFSGLKVEVGYDLEGLLPDGKVGALMDRAAGPLLAQERVGAAALALVTAFAAEIEAHPEAIDGRPDARPDPQQFWTSARTTGFAAGAWLVVAVILVASPRRRRAFAVAYASVPVVIAGCAAAGSAVGQVLAALGVPLFLGVRAQQRTCPVCGAPETTDRRVTPVAGTARYRLTSGCPDHPREQERAPA